MQKDILQGNLATVEARINSLATQKSRMKPGHPKYATRRPEILTAEKTAKWQRSCMQKQLGITAKPTTPELTEADISQLSQFDTCLALNNIRSKKHNEQYAVDKADYESAVQVEKWLMSHRDKLKPVQLPKLSKVTVADILSDASLTPLEKIAALSLLR